MTADTDLPELQKGQLKVASSFGFSFFGGGLLDFLPMSDTLLAIRAFL